MWAVLVIAIEALPSWNCHCQPSPAFLPAQSNPSPGHPVSAIKALCLGSVTEHWVIHDWHQFPCFTSAPSHCRASSASAWKDPSRGQRANPSWTGISASVCPLPTALRTGEEQSWHPARGCTQGRRAGRGFIVQLARGVFVRLPLYL